MAPKFQGVDFYNVDGLLSEEERAVRDTVRAWVDDNLMPVIAEHYVAGKFPKHLVPQMAELGLSGANLPEEYRSEEHTSELQSPDHPSFPTRRSSDLPKFQGVDFYNVDGLLSEEERAVRDTVRAWVDDNLMPVIAEHYVAGKFPKHLVPQMAELGLSGANLPEEYGCAGLNNVAYGLIMQELERGDSGVRSCASVQGALVMYPIHAFGSDEQKRRWLPKMASGEVIGCFGLTEPDYGSNPAGMITVARESESGWILNGAKMWITNGSTAQVAIVWAKTGTP